MGAGIVAAASATVAVLLLSGFIDEHLGSWLWMTFAVIGVTGGPLLAGVLLIRAIHPGPDVSIGPDGVEVYKVFRRKRVPWRLVRAVGSVMRLGEGTPFVSEVVPVTVSDWRDPLYLGIPEGWTPKEFAAFVKGCWDEQRGAP